MKRFIIVLSVIVAYCVFHNATLIAMDCEYVVLGDSCRKIRYKKKDIPVLQQIASKELCIEVNSAQLLPIINKIKEGSKYSSWAGSFFGSNGDEKAWCKQVEQYEDIRNGNQEYRQWYHKVVVLLLCAQQKNQQYSFFALLPNEMIAHVCSFFSFNNLLKKQLTKIGLTQERATRALRAFKANKEEALNPQSCQVSLPSYQMYISAHHIALLIKRGFNWTHQSEDTRDVHSYGGIGNLRFHLDGDCARAIKALSNIRRGFRNGWVEWKNNTLFVPEEMMNSAKQLGFNVEEFHELKELES